MPVDDINRPLLKKIINDFGMDDEASRELLWAHLHAQRQALLGRSRALCSRSLSRGDSTQYLDTAAPQDACDPQRSIYFRIRCSAGSCKKIEVASQVGLQYMPGEKFAVSSGVVRRGSDPCGPAPR